MWRLKSTITCHCIFKIKGHVQLKKHLRLAKLVKRIRTEFYLLHPEKLAKWPQDPFHFLGGGPNPSSLKLLDCGVIPVSGRPIASILYFIF